MSPGFVKRTSCTRVHLSRAFPTRLLGKMSYSLRHIVSYVFAHHCNITMLYFVICDNPCSLCSCMHAILSVVPDIFTVPAVHVYVHLCVYVILQGSYRPWKVLGMGPGKPWISPESKVVLKILLPAPLLAGSPSSPWYNDLHIIRRTACL